MCESQRAVSRHSLDGAAHSEICDDMAVCSSLHKCNLRFQLHCTRTPASLSNAHWLERALAPASIAYQPSPSLAPRNSREARSDRHAVAAISPCRNGAGPRHFSSHGAWYVATIGWPRHIAFVACVLHGPLRLLGVAVACVASTAPRPLITGWPAVVCFFWSWLVAVPNDCVVSVSPCTRWIA